MLCYLNYFATRATSDLALRRSSHMQCIPLSVGRLSYIIPAIPLFVPSTYRHPGFYWKMPAISASNLLT